MTIFNKQLWLISVFACAIRELFRAAPGEATLLTLVMLVQGLIPAISLYLTKLTIDGLNALSRGEPSSLGLIIIWWSSTLLIGVVLAPVNQVLQGNVGERFTAHINLTLMEKASQLPGLEALEDPRFHNDISLLQEGARSRPLNVLVLLVHSLRDLVTLVGLSIVLAAVGWWVPLAALLSAYPLAQMTLKLREVGWNALISRTPEARRMEYESRIALGHAHAAEVRLYRLFGWLINRYRQAFSVSHQAMRSIRQRQAFAVLPANVFSILVASGLFAWSVQRALEGNLSVGQIVVIVSGLSQIQQLVFALIENSGFLLERGLYFQKYFDFLALQPQVRYPVQPKGIREGTPTICFDRVSFRYPDGCEALRDVSFTIRPGTTVAVVGENGAGKSTLIKLLLRFYDSSEGDIQINGVSIKDIDLDQWRDRVGAVFQDFGRYAYSVKENILLARQGVLEPASLQSALLQSGMAAVAEGLDGGLEAQLGKEFGGAELSGGQWQKLVISRALYRRTDVLILDEPTAALDPRSEYELFQQFADLAQGRTTLLVTHRLGSVLMADHILVLKQGRLVEQGTHQELLAANGEYAELWRMQARLYEQAAD